MTFKMSFLVEMYQYAIGFIWESITIFKYILSFLSLQKYYHKEIVTF
jgi:hypothetical protein